MHVDNPAAKILIGFFFFFFLFRTIFFVKIFRKHKIMKLEMVQQL